MRVPSSYNIPGTAFGEAMNLKSEQYMCP